MTYRVPFGDAWSGEADCLACSLRSSVLFSGLTEENFEQIHNPINQFVLHAGDELYRAGDRGQRMFTIRSGSVKLVQYLPDGSQRIVRLLKSTDVTGLESLLDGPYEHDAVAMQDTEICCLPSDTVKQLSEKNPQLHEELLRRWQRALHEADAWLTELSTGSAKQRIARLLLRLVQNAETSECTLFGREDVGAMLGITTETASRTIAEFKRQSLLIETSSNRFVLDIPNLQKIAGEY